MLRYGSKEVKCVYSGKKEVKKAYLGDKLVFNREKSLVYYGSNLSLGAGRYFHAGASARDYALFGGGSNGMDTSSTVTNYADVWAYDKKLIRTKAESLTGTIGWLAATSLGEYCLFGGGLNIPENLRYNHVQSYGKDLTQKRLTNLGVGKWNLAATSNADYAIFAGGQTDKVYYNPVAGVDAYDKDLVHATADDLSIARYCLSGVSIGDYALFGGGRSYSGGTGTRRSNVDAYDKNLVHTIITDLSDGRYMLSATGNGKYALFGGGSNSVSATAASTNLYKIVDAYDKDLTRTIPAELSVAKRYLSATRLGRYAIFGGGESGSDVYTNTVDAYDEELVKTTPTALSIARGRFAAASVGKYALFAGGRSYIEGAGRLNLAIDVYALK